MPRISRSLRRRFAAAGSALALTSAVSVAFAAPAHAGLVPTAYADCTLSSTDRYLSGRVTGFPPSTDFEVFVELTTTGNFVYQGVPLTTDETGAGSTPMTLGGVPVDLTAAIYRDLNGNHRWDPGTDDTVFRGHASLTTCPAEVTLAPK